VSELSALYREDYTAWAKQTAELLKAGRFSELDISHLLEELESMGASEQRELENRLRVLLAHLLKWQYQYRQLSQHWREFDGRSWRNTIIHQRDTLQVLLEKHPGIRRFVADSMVEAYKYARRLAAKETGMPMDTFPPACPYSQAQILNDDFYPPTE
jgi:hypothetical protein